MPSKDNPIIKPRPRTPSHLAFIRSPENLPKVFENAKKGSFEHMHQIQESMHGKPDSAVLKVVLQSLRNCRVPTREELLTKVPDPVARARFAALGLQVVGDQCRCSQSQPNFLDQSGTLIRKYWNVLVDWFTFFLQTGTHLFDFLRLDPITVMKMPVIDLMSLDQVFEGTPFDLRYLPGALELFIITWNCRDTDGTPIVIAKDGLEDGICPIMAIMHRCTEHEAIREQLLLKMIPEDLLPLDTLVESLISRVVKVRGLYDKGEISAQWALAFTLRVVGITFDFASNHMVMNALLDAGFLRIYADAVWGVAKDTSRPLNDKAWQKVTDIIGRLHNWALTVEPALLPKLVWLARGNVLGTTLRILSHLPSSNSEYSMVATSLNLYAVYSSHPPLLAAMHGPMKEFYSADVLVNRVSNKSTQAAEAISDLCSAYYRNKECTEGRWKKTNKRRLCDSLLHPLTQDESMGFDTVSLTCSNCRSAAYCSKQCQREDWVARHRGECRYASREYHHRKSSRLWIRYGFRNYYFSMMEHIASKSRALLLSNYSRGASHIPIFDASTNPYDIKMVSVRDFRERGLLYKFRKDRLNAYLDDYAQRKSDAVYLVGATFFYGIERIHILARMVRVAVCHLEAKAAPFQILNALMHYEHIREDKDEEGHRSRLYDLFTWSLNDNARAMAYRYS